MTKLHSLLLVPFLLLLCNNWKERITLSLAFGFVFLLSVLLILGGQMDLAIFSSLGLYFQNFEFNAGIYFVVRGIGQQLVGYNMIGTIGPVLASVAALTILYLLVRFIKKVHREEMNSQEQLLEALHFGGLALCGYYLLSTTVHPWYLIFPLGVMIMHRSNWLIAWALLGFLSYARYVSEEASGFYYGAVAVEYVLVFLMIIVALSGFHNAQKVITSSSK